jgi:elongation factor Ts
MTVSAQELKQLREETGAGFMECKNALVDAKGDKEKAITLLREKGIASAAKKASRTASQGLIASYIHMDKIGVLLELNCETDFVAKTDDLAGLAKDIAMHIAAANPLYLRREEIPEAVIEKEKEIYQSQMANKPPHVVEKIVEGKLEKYFSDICLVDQVFIKDPDHKKTINDLITEKIAKLGENIVLKRFVRFQLGAS